MCSIKKGNCCSDFKYMNGACEPCYGAHGVNCTQNCNTGFYGFGCRSKCVCHPEELCDSRFGCIENNSTIDKNCIVIISAVATVVLVVILSSIVYFRRKRAKTNRKQKKISSPGRTINDRNSVDRDIRESKMVNSGDETSFHYTLPRQCYKTEFENLSCKNKLQKTLHAPQKFRLFQQKSAQSTSSEETYDFCSQEKETIPYTQLIFKKAIENTREKDIEQSYIEVIDDDKIIAIEVHVAQGKAS